MAEIEDSADDAVNDPALERAKITDAYVRLLEDVDEWLEIMAGFRGKLVNALIKARDL